MGDGDPIGPDDSPSLRVELRRQLDRLEASLRGSPEWDAARTAVEELQERLAAIEPIDASDEEPPGR